MADKIRIIDHLNANHKLALYDYLAYYKNIRLDIDDPHSDAVVKDISLDSLTIWYKTPTHTRTTTVAIIPAMAQMSDARAALVKMAKEAARGTGHEHFRIRHYSPPKLFVGCGGASADSSLVAKFFAGFPQTFAGINIHYPSSLFVVLLWLTPLFPKSLGALWNALLPSKLAAMFTTRARKIAFYTVLIHVAESFFVLLPLLRSVRTPQPQKSIWVLSNLLEGYPAILRLRAEIAAKKK